MICKACGKQFTGEACPYCGVKPESEGRSGELVKLLKNVTDSGSKYREGYEKGLKEGYQNGYVAGSRNSGATTVTTVGGSGAEETTGLTARSFSFKHVLIAAGACFVVGALLFGLLLGGLRYRSGLEEGNTQGYSRGLEDGKAQAPQKAEPGSGSASGFSAVDLENAKEEAYAEGFNEGAKAAMKSVAEARASVKSERLSERVQGEAERKAPGRSILELQKALAELGYSEVIADGTYNWPTREAIRAFRAEYGIGDPTSDVFDSETEELIYFLQAQPEARTR